MAGPETRLVNRCTYAERHPDTRTQEGKAEATALAKLRHPFLKLGVLTTAIDRPGLLNQVLGDGSGTDPQAPVLRQALEAVWAGDLLKAAQLVSGVDVEQVVAFASACVSREQGLWTTAQAALDRAISKQATAVAGSAAVEQPAGEVSPEPSEVADIRLTRADVADQAIRETRDHAAEQVAGMTPAAARQALSRPELVLREGSVSAAVLGTVEPSAVQAQLAESSPKVATFLAGTGYFSLPRPTLDAALAETSRMIAFTELQKYLAAQKQAAIQSLSVLGVTSPIGYLHLERLAFTPVGYERGDLVYSLPMLPHETVRLTHSEWSKTSQEFSQLVATSLETAKQDAVAQTSELTESVTAQQQHSSAFSSSTTASGGFGPVHISETVSANANDSAGRTAQSSAKHSQEITRQASSRSKEEHKITFNVSTSYEVADQSFREFTNTSDQPVRWDFYRLMKKWQIDLYRYDIRLTYDIIIPEPASFLLRRYVELAQLKADLERGFKLTLSPAGITRHTWQDLSNQYDVALDPPPPHTSQGSAQTEVTFSDYLAGSDFLEISLPEGYCFDPADPVEAIKTTDLYVRGSNPRQVAAWIISQRNTNEQILRAGAWRGSTYHWLYEYEWFNLDGVDIAKGDSIAITVTMKGVLTAQALEQWQSQQYSKIVDAARARFETGRQRLQERYDDLKAQLALDDDLALRKIEREEIMKGVLRWLFGTQFSFYPSDLPDLTLDPHKDLPYYGSVSGLVKPKYDEPYAAFGEQIRFMQQAIEWENLNYVLYPYFWTDTRRWDFKQSLHHDDYEHRQFLRAGAARVVLTIRPQFEKAFLSFMETGKLDEFVGPNHLYFKIADEIRAVAETSYPYTPDANEENPANHVGTWYEFTPTSALDVAQGDTIAPEPPPTPVA